MNCYSIIAPRAVHIAHGGAMGMGVVVNYVADPYPKPQDGIVAQKAGGGYVVRVGDKEVRVVPELVKSPHVIAEGEGLRIMRASIVLGSAGDFVLLPELPDDDYTQALLLLDVSRGSNGRVTYNHSKPGRIFVRGYQNYEPFVGEEEVVLAQLGPGDHLTAVRIDKRYIWFGKEQWQEEFHFTHDQVLHASLIRARSDRVERLF